MYGYEMIKALEEKSGGFYSPSPGSIYPTLQLLEERGLVVAQEVEGKKVYSITDAGNALLDEHQQQSPWEHMHKAREERNRGPRPELQALRHEAMEVARLFAIAGRSAISDPAKVARLRVVIESTRKELTDLIYGQPGETPATPPAEPSAE
jgi:DNA-binding PadR family transcriptional regulator